MPDSDTSHSVTITGNYGPRFFGFVVETEGRAICVLPDHLELRPMGGRFLAAVLRALADHPARSLNGTAVS